MLVLLYAFLIGWFGTGHVCLACAAWGSSESYDKWMTRAGLTLLIGFVILTLGLMTYIGWSHYYETNVG